MAFSSTLLRLQLMQQIGHIMHQEFSITVLISVNHAVVLVGVVLRNQKIKNSW
jgi:hypothetical protein